MKAASLPPNVDFEFDMELAKNGVITLDYADKAVAEVTSGSSGELELTFFKPPKDLVNGNGSERQKLRVALAKSASAFGVFMRVAVPSGCLAWRRPSRPGALTRAR